VKRLVVIVKKMALLVEDDDENADDATITNAVVDIICNFIGLE